MDSTLATSSQIEARPGFVELDGEAVTIGDGEVEANVIADGDGGDGKAAMIHEFFEAHGGLAAGRENGEGFAAEIVDDAGGVDASSAGGIVAGEDVGAVIEGEAVDGDGAVDRRVHGERKYQVTMVAYGGGIERGLGCRLGESGCSAAWLARLLGVQEVPGSNPGSPTTYPLLVSNTWLCEIRFTQPNAATPRFSRGFLC